MKLHELRPPAGAKKPRKRVGRGLGSGQGTYAGRGRKGQNARSGGGVAPYFEGGQLPLVRKLPFARGVGFVNFRKVVYAPVNLAALKNFQAGSEITPQVLVEVGLVKSTRQPVVILGDGELDRPLVVKAHRFSQSARLKIETSGGQVELLPLEDKAPNKQLYRRRRQRR
ncbi:MAG: 50S ribosomal protein L15 [Thermoflexales bacterium]|nr:50S ribosomal protein L15 [Thermoflexales bacterium]